MEEYDKNVLITSETTCVYIQRDSDISVIIELQLRTPWKNVPLRSGGNAILLPRPRPTLLYVISSPSG